MFKITANFIDVFKIGDNINYNLDILRVLYEGFNSLNDGYLLIKPIVITNVSITEALLYDFIENRIRKANKSETLFKEAMAELQTKKLDKFEHYIVQAEKYDFFNLGDTKFYKAMHHLRETRNRVHIHNSNFDKPYDESDIFNKKLMILSERVLEKTLITLSSKYLRRAEYHGFVKDFELPWERQFK